VFAGVRLCVQVSRRVIDQYGVMEWVVTFTSNPGFTPTGSGDVNRLVVRQDSFPPGALATQPAVTETQKGSAPLAGYFTLDFADPLQVILRPPETHVRLGLPAPHLQIVARASLLCR
jgi:hypothetical protein